MKSENIIKKVLFKIDKKPFIKLIRDIVSESHSKKSGKKIHEPIKLAVRYICLLDLYHETKDKNYKNYFYDAVIYLNEAKRQKEILYNLIPENQRKSLEKIEKNVLKFFNYESYLRRRLHSWNVFSRNDIRKYIYEKSKDNILYGKILEMLVPGWNLTKELRTKTMLFDIKKDISDYEDDVKNELPNLLCLYFSGNMKKSNIPTSNKKAIQLANEMKISNHILSLATALKNKALKSEELKHSQILKRNITKTYSNLKGLID